MAISGKPPKQTPQAPPPSPAPQVNEHEVLSLIHKGGGVPKSVARVEREAAKQMLIQLRLYPDMVEEIDTERASSGGKRRRPLSRHAWIVQAIEEKLDRDRQSKTPN